MSVADADQRVTAGAALLTAADAGELLTLQLAAWVREGRENATLDIPPLREGLDEVLAQLTNPALRIYGLREAGRLLATVRTSPIDPETALLGRLGVVPDLVGTGLGSAMLRHAEARLPLTVLTVELITGLRSVRNHRFYAQHGYELVGRDEQRKIVVMRHRLMGPRAAAER